MKPTGSSSDSSPPKLARGFASLSRVLLLLFVLWGAYRAIWSSYEVNRVSKAIGEMRRQTGELIVTDPEKVHVTRVPHPSKTPGIGKEDYLGVWQFWIYIPPNMSANLEVQKTVPTDASEFGGGRSSRIEFGTETEGRTLLASISITRPMRKNTSKVHVSIGNSGLTTSYRWKRKDISNGREPQFRAQPMETTPFDSEDILELVACRYIDSNSTNQESSEEEPAKGETMQPGIRVILFDDLRTWPINP